MSKLERTLTAWLGILFIAVLLIAVTMAPTKLEPIGVVDSEPTAPKDECHIRASSAQPNAAAREWHARNPSPGVR